MAPDLSRARLLALLVPAALLGGAYTSQYGFGLFPCEMCWWQRYAHFAALPFALLAFALPKARWPIALAALAIAVSGLIGGYHAGVEYGWWEGFTTCTSAVQLGGSGDPLDAIMNKAPLVSCDQAQWTLFGISLAGFNFAISLGGALLVAALLRRSAKES
ncbi:disulfide bond formation protein B [Novosphingobium flavum]|uniref:Disulfide bond formation protein B n=1 Tax=Novosphingobium flavum TaxID=1778672 RepID=A0A7X1FPE3_9SPHN|nr:disulfide bond formation protein B [Novosphingobium flavum]MBC2664503.1 disulfide bond formation protein B [Novosphingobium flavum]